MPESPNTTDLRIDTLRLRAPSSLALGDPARLAHDVGHALGEALGPDAAATIGAMRLRLPEHALRHQAPKAIARAIARQITGQLRNTKEDSQ